MEKIYIILSMFGYVAFMIIWSQLRQTHTLVEQNRIESEAFRKEMLRIQSELNR